MTTHTRTEHAAYCCAETIDDIRALEGFYEAALHDRDEMAGRLNQAAADLKALKADHEAAKSERDELANALAAALAERDRARDIAARLEAELARGFRTAAPDITLIRTHDGAPGTPDEAVPGPSGALGRPGSALAIRLEAEAAQPYLPAQMPEAVPREDQEGAESGPSRVADGLEGLDWHSGTPATGEARKSAVGRAHGPQPRETPMTSPRDLADELLTLHPVDPARCNTRRKAHPVIGGRALECSECWRERVAERLEQWRQGIHASHPQETK